MDDTHLGETEEKLLPLTRRLYGDYGRSVVDNRALPDFRDGLKPVHRRIVWAMHKLSLRSNGPFRKSAKIVGDTMGDYHPHGDSSIYEAMVHMANTAQPIVDGEGNWGSLSDGAAAMRYTEARLSRYAEECFLQPEYLAITPTMPNYDGHLQEPVYLPALLPNLLINGTYGIAFGITSIMPPMKLEPLLPLIEKIIGGATIGPKAFKKAMVVRYPYGGVISSPDGIIDHWLTKGGVNINFDPVYKVDYDTRLITVTEVPPFFKWENVVKKLGLMPTVSSYDELTSKHDRKARGSKAVHFAVRLKTSVSREDIKAEAAKVINEFATDIRMATNWVERTSEEDSQYTPGTLPNLLMLWTDYRVKLERRVQKHIIGVIDKNIAHLLLMKLAVDNRDIMKSVWQSDTPIKVLMTKLNINEEQANTIYDLTLRRLGKLSGQEIEENIAKAKKNRKQAEEYRDNPGPKVMGDLNTALAIIEKVNKKATPQ